MAPLPSKRKQDDDFVLTLSDLDENDAQDVSEDEADSDAIAGAHISTTAKKTATTTKATNCQGKKRKSDNAVGFVKGRNNKKAKRKGAEESGGEGSEEEEFQEDDGAMDPEFEFDVGGAGGLAGWGEVEEFDGWGVGWVGGEKGRGRTGAGVNKGVDLEGIIERRRTDKEVVDKEDHGDEESEVEDEDEDDAGSVDGLDDELLAEDGFGMGVQPGGEESGSEDGEDATNGKGDSEDNASDSDSVASPVAHPDDLASASSDDESDAPDEKERRKAFFAPEDTTSAKVSSQATPNSFQSFSLSRPIHRGITSIGFTTPTPIQLKTIPIALLGKDVVGGAVTGSGKTAAFIIPILERLLYRPRKIPTTRVAILMPTRELAVQCYNVATKLASFTDITFVQLVGGFSLREQENVLKKRPDVVIATPGRFIDHMRNSASFTVDSLEILVLDEADRMLEDGFADELNEILKTIPKSRQTMLFSATMTESVDKLIRVGLNRPARLMVDAKKSTVGTLTQEFVRLRPGREEKRMGYLALLCKTVYTDRVIVFFRQKKEAHRARIIFGLLGIKAGELHGSMTQEQVLPNSDSAPNLQTNIYIPAYLSNRILPLRHPHTPAGHRPRQPRARHQKRHLRPQLLRPPNP
jgi:ATP-dependent RNA helicase DDX27